MEAIVYYGGFLHRAGGAFTHVADLRRGLEAEGWTVRVVTLDDLPAWARYLPHLVERAANLVARPLGFWWKGRLTGALYRRLFDRPTDLVVFEDIYLAWDAASPCVTMLHALWSDNLQAFRLSDARKRRLIEREKHRLESLRQPVVTVSVPYARFLEDQVFRGQLGRRLDVVEHGIVQPPAPKDVARVPGSIIYVGALEARKNVAFLLEVFAHVHAKDPTRTLTIVGDGPQLEMLQRRASELGVPVRFAGRMSRDDVLRELHAYETYLHTSTKESFSYSLLEAKLAGLRTVAFAGLEVPPEFIDRPVSAFEVDEWVAALIEPAKGPSPFPREKYALARMTRETLRLARGASS